MITDKSTYVNKALPFNQFSGTTDIHVCGQSTQIQRSYIEFNMSDIPSIINSAKLYLYCYTFSVVGTRTLNAKRITSSWAENMTWTSQPSVTTTNLAQISITSTEIPAWKSWDITNMLNDETGSTFGIQITDNDETSSTTYDWYFYSDDYATASLRPYLLINPYYVKTDGDDAKDGLTWANAWKTINKAATTVADGSIVHIGFGTYDAEPAGNKIAPQNVGASGIYYLPETADTGGGTGTVSIEKNP
jgi:hypothetical protein